MNEFYDRWIKESGIKNMTRNQSDFAKFLFDNSTIINTLGDMETIFKSVRKYLKEN
jgi:hypothetical protein